MQFRFTAVNSRIWLLIFCSSSKSSKSWKELLIKMVHIRLERLPVHNIDRLTDHDPNQTRKKLLGGRQGDIKFEVTTEGYEEPCLSSKEWHERVKIRRFNRAINWKGPRWGSRSADTKIFWESTLERQIRDRHCLMLHLKLGILMLDNHIIEQSLNPLLWLDEVWAQLVN